MKKLTKASRYTSQSGQVLIIILAFVVLLSVLAVALLSRSVSDMQIAAAGDNQIKIEMTAQGAISQITADIQQEIAAGSYTPGAPPYNAPGGTYYPLNNTFVVPSPSIGSLAIPTTGCGYENLVKMSCYSKPFFASTANGTYNTSFTVPNRAANTSTLNPSLNYRYISSASWQMPYLTQTTSPVFTSSNYAPNWVLIAKDGSNGLPGTQNGPAVFDSSYTVNSSVSASTPPAMGQAGSNPVLQRYAYAIYDEGSTLDMNVAGEPVSSSGTAISTIASYKNALAYADLSQLPGLSTLSASAQAQVINAIVGWRNNASSLAKGNFPQYTSFPLPSGLGLTPFDTSILSNTNGFMMVGNSALAVNGTAEPTSSPGMSDQPFVSRQQLIQLLESIGSANTTNGVATFTPTVQQQALTCMGTFTRDINQPSYAPNPSRPLIVGNAVSGGNTDYGLDNQINSPFLNVTVSSGGWTRNDGTPAVTGEPLVKKRFALNRLAWLTYQGPSANRNVTSPSSTLNSADYDIYQMEHTYGISQAFLLQGTAANIYKHFGLSWVGDPNNAGASEWVYTHAGGSPTGTNNPSAAPIMGLSTVNNLSSSGGGRDADFFELLKAGICVGSVAKPYTVAASLDGNTPPGSAADYYGQKDADVDNSIIQIGTNIISQYQPSGYPTRILFNDGLFGTTQEHRGIVDLPYIYGAQEAKLRTADSVPSYLSSIPNPTGCPVSGSTTTSGVAYDLQIPIIWNPHAWNSNNPDANPRPTSFRIFAVTTDPNGVPEPNVSEEALWRDWQALEMPSPVTTPQPLTTTNTEMDFNIPYGNSLFREPTLLMKPNVPTGSNLNIGAGNSIQTLTGSNALTSLDTAKYYNGVIADNKQYIGLVVGATKLPLAWSLPNAPKQCIDGTNPTASGTTISVPAEFIILTSGYFITYFLQYQDINNKWITYDEKFSPICESIQYNAWNQFGTPGPWTFSYVTPNEAAVVCFDPRTSRWGMNYSGPNARGSAFMQWAVGNLQNQPTYQLPLGTGWAAPVGSTLGAFQNAATQNAIWTERPDEYQGYVLSWNNNGPNSYSFDSGPLAAGWYAYDGLGMNGQGYSQSLVRPGLTCQNNPAVSSSSSVSAFAPRFKGDPNDTPGTLPYGAGCFADPDGVIRRGMSAYVPPTSTVGEAASPSAATAGAASGIPFKTAYAFSATGAITPNAEVTSRPIMLNRPFHSVADIGYVFSDTPWRNLDFSTPESGNVALLDVFCMNDTSSTKALVAGKVNLNTRQLPVIESILSRAYKDEWNYSSPTPSNIITASGGISTANVLAGSSGKGLVNRTNVSTTGGGPLTNLGDLVGVWQSAVANANTTSPSNIDGGQSYSGFSGTATTTSSPPATPPNLSAILSLDTSVAGYNFNDVSRLREATIRALSNMGETRVWNLMVDLVVQTGKYPASASSLDNFVVESQKRYWVHLAIDRMTGQVIDKQVEVVVQ